MSDIAVISSTPELSDEVFLDWSDIARCSGARVAVDVETTGLEWYREQIIGVGFHCPDRNVHGYMPTWENWERRRVMEIIRDWSEGTVFIAHNLKFELHFLRLNPFMREGWLFIDTPLLVQYWDSRLRKSLDAAEAYFLGTNSKRNHVTQAPQRVKIWDWPERIRADYCANDCLVTYQLAEELIPRIRKLGLWNEYKKDIEYMKILWETEERGFLIDDDFIEQAIKQQQKTVSELEVELFDSCGATFNWRSPQQLSKAIYQGLGIPKPKNPFADADGIDRSRFADAGLYKSTCTSTFLLTEKVHHPLGPLIAALRESAKMAKTLEKYQELADGNRRVHTTFNQARTRTHRLASSGPNLQNVPSMVRGRFTQSVFTGSTERKEEYNLRNSFVAEPGKVLLSVDYKQMEMRMFGILAEDEFMLRALAAGQDIHAEIAQKVWGIVDKTHREWSKTIGFGLIYGMTLGSLMFKLNMTKPQAAQIRDQYLREFPRIMPWMYEVISQCKAFGYITYWNGKIWREDDPTYMYRGANAQIQGGCAGILEEAVLRVYPILKNMGADFHTVNFVHDEIMAEIPREAVMETASEMMRAMEVPDLFPVPFYTDAKAGTSYGNQEKLFGKTAYEQGRTGDGIKSAGEA